MISAFPNVWIPRRELWQPPLEWLTAGKARRDTASKKIKRQTNGKTPRSTAAAGACNCCACSFTICSPTPAIVNANFTGWTACTGCKTSTDPAFNTSNNVSGFNLDGSYDLACYKGGRFDGRFEESALNGYRAVWVYYEFGSFGATYASRDCTGFNSQMTIFRISLVWNSLSTISLDAVLMSGSDPYGNSGSNSFVGLFSRTINRTTQTCQSILNFTTNGYSACSQNSSASGGFGGSAVTTPL